MTIKLPAKKTQEIGFTMRPGDLVEFEDGLFGAVENVVTKKNPRARLLIHTIRMNDGKWRAAVKIYRAH